MADTQPAAAPKARKKRSETADTLVFLLKLAALVFVIRSFIFSPFSIPSESMLPRLYIGDYLFVSKWNYGYSKHSLPFSLPLIPGRVFSRLPARGDVVVFKAPPTDKQDYIKRVIGLPGDTIQMRAGQVILNGTPVPRERIADFVIPQSPNYHCDAAFEDVDAAGAPVCRYQRYRETLPGGKSFETIDRGRTVADDTSVYTVPAGHVFMMGDNRDDSEDSRFSQETGGIGYVPMANLEGKAILTFWSTDGSAAWIKPWTWVSAARWSRIGDGF
ncbi:signal peptidase I [Hephaestia caeni]|uniref:Signal peptidase I n=1 Tax=Hephaestia caeni TaxID=645617 RepID=A0A397NI54_9SPHN|nr:signal peptidase I [Hephaestia caeni]RIA37222.1 signal peptidase I [Hephaestia caeni]